MTFFGSFRLISARVNNSPAFFNVSSTMRMVPRVGMWLFDMLICFILSQFGINLYIINMNLYLSFTILSLRLHIHNLECRRLDALMTAMGALAWVLYLAALLEHKATRPAEGGIHYQAFAVGCDA